MGGAIGNISPIPASATPALYSGNLAVATLSTLSATKQTILDVVSGSGNLICLVASLTVNNANNAINFHVTIDGGSEISTLLLTGVFDQSNTGDGGSSVISIPMGGIPYTTSLLVAKTQTGATGVQYTIYYTV